MTLRVNVTMIARNRHRLTEQAIKSFWDNTGHGTITVLDDASEVPVRDDYLVKNVKYIVRNTKATGGAGPARNQVIREAEKMHGRADLLYLSDNDVYFMPRWLDLLCELWPQAYAEGFRVLGGYQHPFNRTSLGAWPQYSEVMGRTVVVHETLAVATQSWLMDWETWDKYGPFAEAPGVRQSEDVAFCSRVRADGFRVGYVHPFCVLNTSLTDTFGKDVPGVELLRGEVPEGVIAE